MASLDHPNIVRLYDFVEVEGHLVLVMERLFGGTVNSQGPLPPQTACAYVVAACAGLQYAHERGILHRDVKPQNLLLSAEGTLKVGDFGIAKLLNAKGMTLPGMVLGTPSYIAPEQIDGDTLTPAVDVYAAGVVLYELLSAASCRTRGSATPWRSSSSASSTSPCRCASARRTCRTALTAITERALRRDPAERYASAAELAAAIAQAADVEWQAPAPRRHQPIDEPTLIDTVTDDGLLERDRERAALTATVAAAREGQGAVALLQGPAGIGKSRLLEAVVQEGQRVGARTLRARGGEMERDFPYGVVRQLLAREVRDLDGAKLSGAARLAGTVLGLRGAGCGGVRGRRAGVRALPRPVLADLRPGREPAADPDRRRPPTRRPAVAAVPALSGPPPPGAADRDRRRAAGRRVREHRAAQFRVRRARDPPARTRRRRGRALRRRRGSARAPDDEFVAACSDVTGGNPFLLEQLLRAAEDEGIRARRSAPRRACANSSPTRSRTPSWTGCGARHPPSKRWPARSRSSATTSSCATPRSSPTSRPPKRSRAPTASSTSRCCVPAPRSRSCTHSCAPPSSPTCARPDASRCTPARPPCWRPTARRSPPSRRT